MYTSEERTKHIWIILILGVLNIGLALAFGGGAQTLEGEYVAPRSAKLIGAVTKTTLLTIPVMGFILGGLVAFLPYKKLAFKQKYIRASLLTIMSIYGLMLVVKLINF